VIPVSLPPLRDRGNDIVLLADMFIKKFSRQIGKKITPLASSSIDLLLKYHWPGNIRELKHVIERAVILSKDGQLELGRFLPSKHKSFNPMEEVISNGKVLTVAELEEMERQNIIQALNMTSWKISGKTGAASMLGIPPSTLNSKIKAFGIER
jgi:formate hydrogenlyase transcriptional activator